MYICVYIFIVCILYTYTSIYVNMCMYILLYTYTCVLYYTCILCTYMLYVCVRVLVCGGVHTCAYICLKFIVLNIYILLYIYCCFNIVLYNFSMFIQFFMFFCLLNNLCYNCIDEKLEQIYQPGCFKTRFFKIFINAKYF